MYFLRIHVCMNEWTILKRYYCFETIGSSVFWKFTSEENPFEEQEEEEEGEDFIDTGGVRTNIALVQLEFIIKFYAILSYK